MKRYDLRHLKKDFLPKMGEIIKSMENDEVAIFLFEANDFTYVQESASLVEGLNSTLMNSLRFNQVDWTIVVKKAKHENS